MVTNRRFRALVFPLLLYSVSLPVTGYFVWHAVNGERGLKAKEEYRQNALRLDGERKALLRKRDRLERRIGLLRPAGVERDLLEGIARQRLGWVHKDDLVIFLKNDR